MSNRTELLSELEALCEKNKKAQFYLRKGTAENCFGKKKWRFLKYYKYNGIQKGTLKNYEDRIQYVEADYRLLDGVYLIPHKTPGLENIGKREMMYQKTTNGFIPDNFSHEQSLVLRTDKGLVIFNSCSHGGADNIINEVKDAFPDEKIYALIGGFHLYRSKENEVRALAQRIKDTGIEKICTGHCTGDKAFRILKEALGDKAEQLHVGLEIEI